MFMKSPILPVSNNVFILVLWVIFSLASFAQQNVINSGWQFSENKKDWSTINVPHTWNAEDAFDDERGYRRGLGYYKKQLFFANEQKKNVHYLKFNAVNQEATIYVNGKLVGNHKGGYTAFSFNITDYLTFDDYNLIEVTVDNSHNTDIPPLDADFTFYGGIYRDVELISVPKQHISLSDFASDGFYIDYPKVSEKEALVEVKVLVDNFDSSNSTNSLLLTITDNEGKIITRKTEKLKINGNSTVTSVTKFPKIPEPKLWSPETPYLYQLTITLNDSNGNILDEKSQKIAFRWVSVDPNKGLFLNGKPYKMIGVNRHQDYEGYGNAVPMHLQKKDIHLMKEMGANVLRFGHYPHARELYKLCDELGILVWSEIPIVNKVTNTPEFFKNCLTMQEEHLKQYYNYPSIIMFGYMNEIFLRNSFDNKATQEEKEQSKLYTYDLAKQLEDFTRKTAPNRLTVMALHFNEVYNETKIADLSMLIGWNLYFGWYNGKIPDLGEFLDDQHRRFPNRSIMISEYGPGADVKISSSTPKKYDYTQEYQLILHKSYYEQVQARDFVAGMTAWNFADFGSEFRGETIPHVNQKGLIQYDRETKDVYFWYQSVLTDAPLIHIAVNEKHSINMIDETVHSVSIFSNQKEGKAYLNDEFLKDIKFETGLATVDIPFKNGSNVLEIRSGNFQVKRTVDVIKINNFKNSNLERFGINIGSHVNYYDEELDLTFVADRPYSENLFGHLNGTPYNISEDRNQGIPNNIKNTERDALYQMLLEDCTDYKVDLKDGNYKITLYFVEPQLRSDVELIYNLTDSNKVIDKNQQQRIFDVVLNDQVIEKQFNMSQRVPDKYGIEISSLLKIKNNQGLTIHLKPIEGKTVISGVLIEKL